MQEEYLSELFKAYKDYKKGYYESSGIYSSDDVKRAISRRKIFVFPSNFHKTDYTFMIFGIVLLGIMLILMYFSVKSFMENNMPYPIAFAFIGPAFSTTIIIIGFVYANKKKKLFMVLSPHGVLYQFKIGGIKYFMWKEVTDMAPIRVTKLGSNFKWVEVWCELMNEKVLKFKLLNYNREEFLSENWEEQFYFLFRVYWEIGRNES